MNVRRKVRLFGLLLLLLGVAAPMHAMAAAGAVALGQAPVEPHSGRLSDDRVIAPAPSVRSSTAGIVADRRVDDGHVRVLADVTITVVPAPPQVVAWPGVQPGSHPADTPNPPRPGRAPPAA